MERGEWRKPLQFSYFVAEVRWEGALGQSPSPLSEVSYLR